MPRTFEKARNGIEAGVRRQGRRASALYRWALGVGDRASRAQREGGRLGLRLRLQWTLADRWVLAGIRERFSRLVVGGVGLYFLVHFFIHASVNLGLVPLTGLTLPLISTGGSSLLASFTALGLALGHAARREATLDRDAFRA